MGATSLAHAVDAALTPELALRYLRELAADLVAGVVLDSDGRRLAGDPGLADVATGVLRDAATPALAQTSHAGHLVTVARSPGHALLAVHTAHALPGLVRHDLGTVLGDLVAEHDPPAAAVALTASPAALDAVVRAALAASAGPPPDGSGAAQTAS